MCRPAASVGDGLTARLQPSAWLDSCPSCALVEPSEDLRDPVPPSVEAGLPGPGCFWICLGLAPVWLWASGPSGMPGSLRSPSVWQGGSLSLSPQNCPPHCTLPEMERVVSRTLPDDLGEPRRVPCRLGALWGSQWKQGPADPTQWGTVGFTPPLCPRLPSHARDWSGGLSVQMERGP